MCSSTVFDFVSPQIYLGEALARALFICWMKMCVDISVVGSENTKHTQHFIIVELATT